MRQDRAEAHGDRRELPEIRHQIRMRIRRQPAALGEFLPEILQMSLVQPAFEKRPRIHARRGVALEINHVAGKILRAPAEKMVERHFVKRRRRGVGRDVPADVRGGIGLDHHRHRVPADVALDAALDLAVAGKRRLLLRRNGVDVRRVEAARQPGLRGAQTGRPVFPAIAPCAPAPGFPAPVQKPIAATPTICRRCRRRNGARS